MIRFKRVDNLSEISYTINDLRNACKNDKIAWKEHATQRLIQRHIMKADAIECVLNGEIIETYISDKPFASCLVFGYTERKRPIHVVCSFDGEYIHFITAYEPDTIKFYSDLKTRRRNIK